MSRTFWKLRKSFPFGRHRTRGNGMFLFLTCIDAIKGFAECMFPTRRGILVRRLLDVIATIVKSEISS